MATGLRLRPRRVTLLAGLASGCILLGAALIACASNDGPGYAQSSSSSGDLPDGGGADAEAGLPQPQGSLCQGLVVAPKEIDEVTQAGGALPPIGGVVAPGTYDLEGLYTYGPVDAGADAGEQPIEGLSGRSGRGTLVVTKDTLAFIEAYGPTGALPPAAATGYAYTAAGTTISAARVCPETVATKDIPYSAVGDSLALFVDSTHRVVFRRRPQ